MKSKLLVIGSVIILLVVCFWMNPVTTIVLLVAIGLYGWGSTPRKEAKHAEPKT